MNKNIFLSSMIALPQRLMMTKQSVMSLDFANRTTFNLHGNLRGDQHSLAGSQEEENVDTEKPADLDNGKAGHPVTDWPCSLCFSTDPHLCWRSTQISVLALDAMGWRILIWV